LKSFAGEQKSSRSARLHSCQPLLRRRCGKEDGTGSDSSFFKPWLSGIIIIVSCGKFADFKAFVIASLQFVSLGLTGCKM
jgi:hypothetical protein